MTQFSFRNRLSSQQTVDECKGKLSAGRFYTTSPGE
jgi:hypothetical protein